MKCTGKEWDTCRVEKMGCRGCYYDEKKFIEFTKDQEGVNVYCIKEDITVGDVLMGVAATIIKEKDLKIIRKIDYLRNNTILNLYGGNVR